MHKNKTYSRKVRINKRKQMKTIIGKYFKTEKDAIEFISKKESDCVWNLYELKDGFIAQESKLEKDVLQYIPIKQTI